jgi:CCR4-NOT transcription complex subunit 2
MQPNPQSVVPNAQQQQRARGSSATNDQFGMLGFNQQDVNNQIFRPVDLNSLGIAVSSSEQLHLTFGSPWQDNHSTHRLQPEFRIPECYYVTAPVIKYALFQKLHLETLFYIFYSMPRDVLQVAAARELNTRDWRFHKPMQQWITRVQGTEPKPVPGVPKGTAERGSYSVWNVEKWSIDRLDNFTLNIQDIEESAANAAQQQQQAQQQAQQQPGSNNNQQVPSSQQQQVPPGGQVRQ